MVVVCVGVYGGGVCGGIVVIVWWKCVCGGMCGVVVCVWWYCGDGVVAVCVCVVCMCGVGRDGVVLLWYWCQVYKIIIKIFALITVSSP